MLFRLVSHSHQRREGHWRDKPLFLRRISSRKGRHFIPAETLSSSGALLRSHSLSSVVAKSPHTIEWRVMGGENFRDASFRESMRAEESLEMESRRSDLTKDVKEIEEQ